MLKLAQELLEKRPSIAQYMEIVAVELQYDRKKLIVYAKMKKWASHAGKGQQFSSRKTNSILAIFT